MALTYVAISPSGQHVHGAVASYDFRAWLNLRRWQGWGPIAVVDLCNERIVAELDDKGKVRVSLTVPGGVR